MEVDNQLGIHSDYKSKLSYMSANASMFPTAATGSC